MNQITYYKRQLAHWVKCQKFHMAQAYLANREVRECQAKIDKLEERKEEGKEESYENM